MTDKYILNGHLAVPEPDLLTWGKWLQTADRVVAKTNIGDSQVSTVFLGLDHSFGGDKPMLFETMVFGGSFDGEQERCSTWEEAEEMHNQMIQKVSSKDSQ